MGYSIKIGKVKLDTAEAVRKINEEDYGYCLQYKLYIEPCEGEEPEGLTNGEFTLTPGEPRRDPSYIGWGDFMRCCKPLRDIQEEINPGGSDGNCYVLNTDFIKSKIEEVEKEITSMSTINQDRAKWLCFWVKEAIKRYGDDAAIGFW